MANQTITYGTSTAINTNTFTRTDYTFKGWRAYREATKQWFCTNGSSFGWYAKSDIPAGYTYYIFDDGEYVATTGVGTGETITVYSDLIECTKY